MQVPDFSNDAAAEDGDAGGVPPAEANRDARNRATRLKQAIDLCGGVKAVAARSGVPYGTISHYLLGREMKAGSMVALAAACGIALDWLATGAGPMVPEAAAKKSGLNVAVTQTVYREGDALFATLDLHRLGRAITGAITRFESANKVPSPHDLAMVTALLYDSEPERQATAEPLSESPES